MPDAGPAIRVRPLRRNDWPRIEALFGSRGACGGCWCMVWRSELGGRQYRQQLGEPNRKAFEALVTAGKVHGVLAFMGDEPVGWCSIGPRADFPGLARSRVLQTEWSKGTWSVTCFFIPPRFRGLGVATAMLEEAIGIARRKGASDLEGYPVKVKADGTPMPGPFAWTGVPALFEKLAFDRVASKGARPIYRQTLGRR